MAIKLTIDGRAVEAQPGSTVLAAARGALIEIPTMCYAEGVEPSASCFLCVVRVAGREGLAPSCQTLAQEGMVVTTVSEKIRAARRMALELLLSDHTGDCVGPCTLACPAGLDIPGFLRHTAAGRAREAIALIKETIPLAATLGRICPRYCERVCRRRELDEPIAICLLKRFEGDRDLESAKPFLPRVKPLTGKKAAIVGAGPAGLSAAFYLLREGHACTLFDAQASPGGMLRYSIPEFRLPKKVLDGEIAVIERMGAAFKMNARLGRDFSLEELRKRFDAVFLATGLSSENTPGFEGAESATSALEYLRRLNTKGAIQTLETVAVLGGSNEAVDAARSALRLGAKQVFLFFSGERSAMRCFGEWVDEAIEEGVCLETNTKILRLEKAPQNTLRLTGEKEGKPLILEVSQVLYTSERRCDAEGMAGQGIESAGGKIRADRETFVTNIEGVFAGGEAVTGAAAAVRTVAAGRHAARSMHQYLSGLRPTPAAHEIHSLMGKLSEEELARLFRGLEKHGRFEPPTIEIERRRASSDEVQPGMTEDEAKAEAARCLGCDCLARDDCKLRRYSSEYEARTGAFRGARRPFERDTTHPEIVYESGKCILCGLCVRIATRQGAPNAVGFVNRGFETRMRAPFDGPLSEGLGGAARACVEACPTGALRFARKSQG